MIWFLLIWGVVLLYYGLNNVLYDLDCMYKFLGSGPYYLRIKDN